MNVQDGFTLVSLIGSSAEAEALEALCRASGIEHITVLEGRDVLEMLLEFDVNLIVFHTNAGIHNIVSTMEMIQHDTLLKKIPVVVLSDMDDNETLASDLSEYMVLSILAYANWKFQFKRLLDYLQSQVKRRRYLDRELEDSEAKNIIDALTGTLNRSGVAAKFEQLVSYYQSNGEHFSFVLFDIDHFKKVNDSYGHDVGDEVLVGVCSKVQEVIGQEDALCRFGGEEFIVFLANTELETAIQRAECLREAVASQRYSSCELKITASFGVVEYMVNEMLESVIARADGLLYQAKNEGRNRVCATD